MASFSRSGTFFIARGRFDWKKLRDYAAHQGGSCYQDLCRMQGSTPERHISFLPLRDDALALAVSTNDLAATRLTKTAAPVTTPLPSAPVWLSVPGAELRRQDALPPSMHLMLSALTSADRVVITLGPGAQGIEAELQATCRTQDDARILASQLRSTTGLLKEAFARDKSASRWRSWPPCCLREFSIRRTAGSPGNGPCGRVCWTLDQRALMATDRAALGQSAIAPRWFGTLSANISGG